VQEFDMWANPELAALINTKDERNLHRSVKFALWAGVEALKQAGLLNEDGVIDHTVVNPDLVGVSIGTGVGGADVLGESRLRLEDGKRIPPSELMQMLLDRATTVPSMTFKARGPLGGVTAACATGNANIIKAADLLGRGRANVMIAGGTEAQITPEGIGLFDRTRALDTTADPRLASRPFHTDANGFVMGEGAGVLILETLEHARRRGAVVLAELVGYAETADAYHDTAPSGEGAERALRLALNGLPIENIRNIYVNAHATGTAGDAVELAAIGRVLEPKEVVGVSSTKGASGHMLGAASAFESIVSIEALRRGMIPPSLKLDDPVPETTAWNMSPFTATPAEVDLAVNNSFGFGGINAVTVYGAA
jgi:3-oxoacyl-[acyl-carrier-protein] synthase II